MSLGQKLAPHLPFLRRYARALTGSQAHGDAFVKATLDAIITAPQTFPREADPRLGLYKTFHAIWASANAEDEPPLPDLSEKAGFVQARFAPIPSLSRQALLLTAMEGFTPSDAGYLLGASGDEVENLVTEALAEIERQTRADVLIIEDDPIVAMDIEKIVRDLGHNVTGVAVTRVEAVAQAMAQRPGLILADIQLADDSSGIDAVDDILAEFKVPVIFITAFPERLLGKGRSEPPFLITKPFQISTVKAAIAQALFFDTTTLPPNEPAPVVPEDRQLRPISRELVRARLGPVNAKVVRRQIRLVDSTPAEPATSERRVEAVRRLHLATAKRLCDGLKGSNVGPGFNARLEGARKLLSRRLSQEKGLQLAIQVRGLEGMLSAICERLDNVTAADVSMFISDLVDLLQQFPSYRQFMEEAQDAGPINEEGQKIAGQIAALLAQQPDEVLEPALKAAISSIRDAAQNQRERMSALALVRTIGNTFRAVGRFINERIARVQSTATKAFDETTGKALGNSLAYLIVGSPIAGLLTLLYSIYPAEFAFVAQLLRAAKALL